MRELNIDSVLYKKGDTVKLIGDEEGIIMKVEKMIWLTNYYVKITKGGVFNNVGSIVSLLSKNFK